MAPANIRGREARSQFPGTQKLNLGRISKSSRTDQSHGVLATSQKRAYSQLVRERENEEQNEKEQSFRARSRGTKRNRDDSDSDEEEYLRSSRSIRNKKSKDALQTIQLPTPGSSPSGTDTETSTLPRQISRTSKSAPGPSGSPSTLPLGLADLVSIHASLGKALSLHFAHNGSSAPAELNSLLNSTTQLWKKRKVEQEDIQRILALYEVAVDPTLLGTHAVDRKHCPFKMVVSGLGLNIRTNLEYVDDQSFVEQRVQARFEELVHDLNSKYSLSDLEVTSLPRLKMEMGILTAIRQEKTASIRREILSLSSAAQTRSQPDFDRLSISDPSEHTPASIKSKTLSLFERVRAKGLANAANAAPSTEQVQRRHAIGRIAEVVEFLRMKQQQKLGASFHSSDFHSRDRVKSRISFSVGQIIKEIRESVCIPMGEEEVKICLQLLAKEVPENAGWLSIFEMGLVHSVTLQGNGMSGVEIKKLLDSRNKLQCEGLMFRARFCQLSTAEFTWDSKSVLFG